MKTNIKSIMKKMQITKKMKIMNEILTGTRKFRFLALPLILSILSLEAISAISMLALSLPNNPMPWSFLGLLRYGFYREVISSTLIASLPLILFCCFLKKGVYRYLSYILTGFFGIVITSFYLGLLIFNYLEGSLYSNHSLFLFVFNLDASSSLAYKHFIQAQGLMFAITLLIAGHFLFERYRPASRALGSAHFANGLEIKKAGLFEKEDESLIIGKKFGRPIYSNGFEHILVFAPTGSGKTRSIAIPNLFSYSYSVACNDVKFSLFKTTSGFREQVFGHKCYCWALADMKSRTHRYNPFDLISKDKMLRMIDIQRIAHTWIPDNPKEAPIWTKAPRKLLKTLLLYLLDTPDRPTTLGEMNRIIKQQDFDAWLLKILEETRDYDPEFYRNGFSYINTHAETRANILITFSGYFELFDDPVVDAATSASDFDIRNLRREKMTIYVGFSDDDLSRLSPILTLFWQQLIAVMIRKIPDPIDEPYPLLCLIDEFSSLGRLEQVRQSLKLLREYRVRCILMFQYISQTFERYSHDEAKAFTNIKTKVAYTCEDITDAEFISKNLGTRTKRIVSHSISSQHQGVNESKSVSYQAIPLMRPEEIIKMPKHVSLIIRSGMSPVKARQYIWYKQAEMKYLPQGQSFVPVQSPKRQEFEWKEEPKLLKNESGKAFNKKEETKVSKRKERIREKEDQEVDWIDG